MSQNADSFHRNYESVIGLEVHCQLNTKTKLFCACSTDFGALPNHHTCPICLGMPGALPVLNHAVTDYAIKLALAVGATIKEKSVFSRKQYFYPDLPKGYQISQYDEPFCVGGGIHLDSGYFVPLTRIHIEEDAGKNVHGDNASYVDLNRAGTPLLEIVSEPAIYSPADAAEYLKKLRVLVSYLGISDGNLEEGSFRCDANVSVREKGTQKLGTRTEIKNLNSFRNIEKAITYEIIRQIDCLENGLDIKQQTLQYDAAAGKTLAMRSKEESQDYRYFPEPDLRPLIVSQRRIDQVTENLPELPEHRKNRFINNYNLNEDVACLLSEEKELADYFELVVVKLNDKLTAKVAANWVTTELLRVLNERELEISKSPVSGSDLADLLVLLGEGTISGKIAKKVFDLMVKEGKKPSQIVEEYGLVQVSDEKAILAVVSQVVASSPKQVEQYLSGKEKVFGYFVGQVMKQSAGKFNPALVNSALKKEIDAKRKP